MEILIAGGSGFIGRMLTAELLQAHHTITLLSRRHGRDLKFDSPVKVVPWDAKTSSGIVRILEDADAVINLTGEPIAAKRWSRRQKRAILSSRVQSTAALIDGIQKARKKPSVLLNASAVGFYGHVAEGDVPETVSKGSGFLSDVCGQWEKEAMKAQLVGVRVVLLRTGIVLDPAHGALQKLLLPYRLGIGGHLGNGKQWFPWIHIQDEVNAILYALTHQQISGPVNLAAPDSLRMKEFCIQLGKILQRPSWAHVPGWFLRSIFGEMAAPLLLEGQKVIPKKLLDAGFQFRFPNVHSALQDLFG